MPINTALAAKPSGCVIWVQVDPDTLLPVHWLWFGGRPGEPLPALNGKVGKHTKANAAGVKTQRANIRELRRLEFTQLDGLEDLSSRLFGPDPTRSIAVVRDYVTRRNAEVRLPEAGWLPKVARGDFLAIPAHPDFHECCALAFLVDGCELAGLDGPEAVITHLGDVVGANAAGIALAPGATWAALHLHVSGVLEENGQPTLSEYGLIYDLAKRLRRQLVT